MTLIVEAPSGYPDERRYVIDVVLREWLGIDYSLRLTGVPGLVVIRAAHETRHRQLTLPDVLFATTLDDWLVARSLPVTPIRYARIDSVAPFRRRVGFSDENGTLPILYADSTPSQAGESGAAIHLGIDIFGSVFFLLSRYEEVVTRTRDKHGRFPASASVTSAFLERPLADEYVELLWAAIAHLWPDIRRRESAFRLWLTHDVDEPWATVGRPLRTVAHAVAGDLLKRHDPGLAARRTRSLVRARSGPVDDDPFDTFDFLMTISERHGLSSAFFFMSGAPGGMDGTYRLSDKPIRSLLRSVHERGHEVGLHATYDSYRSETKIRAEIAALRDACHDIGFDQPRWGIRQHYLRIDTTETWASQESAGLDYDTSLGYADRPGFRAGTCREFPVFDLLRRQRIELRERPLLVMDSTLFSYMDLDVDAAAAHSKQIVDRCRRYGGEAVILYHNTSVATASFRAHYAAFVAALVG